MPRAVPVEVLLASSVDPRATSAVVEALGGRARALDHDGSLTAAAVAVAAASPVLARLLVEDHAAFGVSPRPTGRWPSTTPARRGWLDGST